MRIGVLGGSFDPIHNGHLILARLAFEQLQLDRVLFTVASSQPFKTGRHAAPADDRLRMVQLALDSLVDFHADDRELRRPGPSYTIDTLRELAAGAPDAELVLVMGADVARGMTAWREPAAIRSLARVAVCRRGPSIDEPAPGDLTVAVPVLEISSTTVRARAAAGLSLAGWVPPLVADYIVASRIYGSRAG